LPQLELLRMDPTFLNRNVNEGFSGGEKKRNEILQLAVLEVRPAAARQAFAGAGMADRAAAPALPMPQ
jgi:Fe-S cluster assembly ATP-binding protein